MSRLETIKYLGIIKETLDRETDTIHEVSMVIGCLKHEIESPESETLSLAEKALDNCFENLCTIYQDLKEKIGALSEEEANKDLPPPKKAH